MSHRSLLAAAFLTLAPSTVAGQQLSLMAGRAEYDLSGVETSNVWAGRLAWWWCLPTRSCPRLKP